MLFAYLSYICFVLFSSVLFCSLNCLLCQSTLVRIRAAIHNRVLLLIRISRHHREQLCVRALSGNIFRGVISNCQIAAMIMSTQRIKQNISLAIITSYWYVISLEMCESAIHRETQYDFDHWNRIIMSWFESERTQNTAFSAKVTHSKIFMIFGFYFCLFCDYLIFTWLST